MLVALLKSVLYQAIMATRSKHRIRGATFGLGFHMIRGCSVSRALHLGRSFERSVFRPHRQKFEIPITY